MNTRQITTEEELVSLKDSWDRLVYGNSETNMPFFSWDWFYRSWLHFGKPNGQELAVVIVEDHGQVVGILPLVRGSKKSSGISYRTLEFCNIGIMPRNTVYVDSASDRNAVFQAVRQFLFSVRKSWDMLELANIPETSGFHQFWLEKTDDGLEKIIQRRGLTALYVKAEGTIEDYISSLSRNTRRYFRKRLKHFEDLGAAKQVRFFEKPEEIKEGLELAFEVHRNSWKGEYSTQHYPDFYREVSLPLSQRDEVLIAVVSLEEKPIAAGYIVKKNEDFYYIVTDYDSRYGEYSPGMMLFIYELEHIIQAGGKTFDFCGTAYEYKEKLTEDRLNHSTFQIFHTGLKSCLLYSAKTFWLPLLRKILRKPEPDDLLSASTKTALDEKRDTEVGDTETD